MARRKHGGRRRVASRPAAGGVLAVGAALLAASTVASSGPVAAQERSATTVAAEPTAPARPRGAGGNTPPTATLPAERRTAGQIVHDGPDVVGTSGIPAAVLAAYRRAADRTALVQPACQLPLELVAAIGKVESGHARGGQVLADGTTPHPILGPVLDGAGPFAAIADTDGGSLDGDPVWDRAVGPMQFIPGTWARWRTDGNLDGRTDPHNVYDASLAAARYLCAGGRDLATPAGLETAVLSYNNSASYLSLVRAWMVVYANVAVTGLPDDGPVDLAAPAPPAPPPTTTPQAPPATTPPAPPTTTLPPAQPPAPTPPPVPTEPVRPPTTPPTTEPPAAEPEPEPEPAPSGGLLCGLLGGLGGLLGLGPPC